MVEWLNAKRKILFALHILAEWQHHWSGRLYWNELNSVAASADDDYNIIFFSIETERKVKGKRTIEHCFVEWIEDKVSLNDLGQICRRNLFLLCQSQQKHIQFETFTM